MFVISGRLFRVPRRPPDRHEAQRGCLRTSGSLLPSPLRNREGWQTQPLQFPVEVLCECAPVPRELVPARIFRPPLRRLFLLFL